ncbi:MAG: GntR family transcriptional regulator [Actinomycetota bacterium]
MAHESIRPLKRPVPLRERVYARLEELIIYGTLAPGQHLVEADIAGRLGVSRIPVREALQLLHRDGWVELRPRQGAFVHQPTRREVEDVFSVRTLLEVESTRLAARHASPESVATLRGLLQAGIKALARGDERELVTLNSEFHGEITSISGNQVLASLIARLDKRIRWYFAPVVRLRGADSWREHAEIVDAITARDEDAAAQAMRRHAELTKAAYREERQRREPLEPAAQNDAAGRLEPADDVRS